MLVHLLVKENKALTVAWKTPFTKDPDCGVGYEDVACKINGWNS